MSNNYSILVNTTDSFGDAWLPFFKLFSTYWPGYNGEIYLNTESKLFSYGNLNIISIRNDFIGEMHRKNWSECLLAALQVIKSDIILYMQEDYFLTAPVRADLIEHYAILMNKSDMDCIHLTDQNSSGPFEPSAHEDLWLIGKNAPYRISCQAALWKKNVLIEYIRVHENPWQFEYYGTKRSSLLNHKFYSVSRDIYKLNEYEIIPYLFTGIIKGRWIEPVVELFSKHDIQMDFTKRGFFNETPPRILPQRIKDRLKALPVDFKSTWEIIKMKLSTNNTAHE